MDKIEMLARMWMSCDPNRGGSDPDELTEISGKMKPRWNWFVPRAEASLEWFEKHGFELK